MGATRTSSGFNSALPSQSSIERLSPFHSASDSAGPVSFRGNFLTKIAKTIGLVLVVCVAGVSASEARAADMPPPSEIQAALAAVHAQFQTVQGGEVATYIPELAKQDPKLFGIALVTVDGRVLTAGDTEAPFTIQSIAKPFVYGVALQQNGREAMLEKVGAEPTGLPFNSIIASEVRAHPLQNPLVNAGAIATASLIQGGSPDEKLQVTEDAFSSYSGEKATVDEAVYRSEMATNNGNMALAYLLARDDHLYGDPTDSVDRYTRIGCINVTARTLALMGATLANGGVQPVTGKRVIDTQYVDEVLSVMLMAGMYDFSGTWMYEVGLPAKSGVGGGIVAVAPGRFAIGTFSPRLDPNGNSVRGILAITELARRWDLHLFHR